MSRVLSFVCLTLAACEPPYAPADQLTDARILAIQSTPVDLSPGNSTTLSALLYLPPGSPSPVYSWSWCPSATGLTTDFTCSITSMALTSALDPNGLLGITIDYSLGSTATVDFAYPVDPNTLQSLCAASPASQPTTSTTASTATSSPTVSLPCADGASIAIDLLLTVQVGSRLLRAIKTLTLDFTASTTVNTNPTITSLAFEPDSGSGTTSALTAIIPSSASDSYTDTDPNGVLQQHFESLTLNWYVGAGSFGRASTSLPALNGPSPIADTRNWTPLLSNTWTAPGPLDQETGTGFILVLQDDRNGVSWLTTTLGDAQSSNSQPTGAR